MSCGDSSTTSAQGVSLTSIRVLTCKEGYSQWKFKMRMYLLHEDLWYSIIGYPEGDASSEAVKKVKDLKALTKICLSLEGGAITHVRSCDTAKQAWDALAKAYEDAGMGRRLSLERKLYRYQLVDFSTIEAYINAVLNTAQDLADIGRQIDDLSIGAILLGGLSPEFDPLVMALENSNVAVTSELVKSKLLNESEKRASKESALLTKSTLCENSREERVRRIVCYHCKEPGHKRPDCPLRGKVKKEKETGTDTTLLSALGVGSSFNPEDWFIDSGASTHMTCNKDWLTNFRQLTGETITLADNKRLSSAGVGDVILPKDTNDNSKITSIKDVLYVPDLSTNLISVRRAVEKGITIIFDESGCSLYKHNAVKVIGKTIGHATFTGSLYRFDKGPVRERALIAENMPTSELWHCRLGHLCRIALEHLRKGKATGINYSKLDTSPCIACVEGKQSRKPFKPIKYDRGTSILELIHTDLCGPFEVTSIEGNRYLLVFIDDFTRMVFVYFISSKTEVRNKFKEFQAQVERETGNKIKFVRSDNGTEYVNYEFSNYLSSQGIQHQTTVPHCPSSNGIAERTIRSLVEKARCMIQQSNLPKTFWEEAVHTAAYIKNRCPHRALKNSTPYEQWFKVKPDLSHLRVFGCRAYVHVPDCERKKLDAKAKQYIFTGYCMDDKSYRFRDPACIRKVVKGRDVVFLENCFSNTEISEVLNYHNIVLTSNNIQVDRPVPLTEEGVEFCDASSDPVPDPVPVCRSCIPVPVPPLSTVTADRQTTVTDIASIVEPKPSSSRDDDEPEGRYNLRERKQVNYLFNAFVDDQLSEEPFSYADVLSRPDKVKWIDAMKQEYQSLMNNNTWTLVENVGQKVIPCKWVFKLKRDSDGKISKYKARLVAKGFRQSYGVDYEETFCPVVRYSSLRILIALAAEYNLKMHHLDIDSAFLHGDLEEEVYMIQPEGFLVKDRESEVCWLRKSLYGLKQAARAWNKRLHQVLIALGYKNLTSEPCVYTRQVNNVFCILAIYVDDLVLFYSQDCELDYLKDGLAEHFGIKDLGSLKFCLGLHINRLSNNEIKVNQRRYILDILKRFNMENCKSVGTPIEPGIDLWSSDENHEVLDVPYQSLIGSLMYLAVSTRPDISYAVSCLSQFNKKPTHTHWVAAKRVLAYLKGTLDYGLTFKKSAKRLSGYVDADWANDRDRKSYTGYIFIYSNGPVSWECKKQQTVALSSTEAEYMALSSASKEAISLQRLLQDLTGKYEPVLLYNDNQSAQKLAQNPVHHSRTKHIDVRYHFIRELVDNGKVKLEYKPSNEMIADVMTKGLPKVKHIKCISRFVY